MLSSGVPRSVASMLTTFSGCSFSTSRPKNGTPVRPICSRGSGCFSTVRVTITNARPVIGPSCTCGMNETSKRSFDMDAAAGAEGAPAFVARAGACAALMEATSAAANVTLAARPAHSLQNDVFTAPPSWGSVPENTILQPPNELRLWTRRVIGETRAGNRSRRGDF